MVARALLARFKPSIFPRSHPYLALRPRLLLRIPVAAALSTMANPVASSSEPAQIPALTSPHADGLSDQKAKKAKQQVVSEYPLEVAHFNMKYGL